MSRPILFIGLGGAGGKTLRAIKQQLNQGLSTKSHSDGIPAAWQFLQIDTPRFQDGESFPAPMLPPEEYYSVVKSDGSLQDIIKRVEGLGSPAETQKMLAGWSTEASPIPISRGAGQIRSIGRLALVGDLKNTFDAIHNAISKMLSPVAISELQAAASILDFELKETTPQVFIISSLAGGTGSGMFIDIAELVKRATNAPWGREVISLLYVPEVFRNLGSMGSMIPNNTLGALNELIASRTIGLSENTEILYRKSGLPQDENLSSLTHGSAENILIDAISEDMDSCFLRFGQSLAEAISEDEISAFLAKQLSASTSQRVFNFDFSDVAQRLLISKNQFGMKTCPDELIIWANPSLFNPILMKAFESKSTAQTWQYFWMARRSRPLVESIPFSIDSRRSIITGWFLATFFGIRTIENSDIRRSVRIWNPTLFEPDWSSFPSPLLVSHREDMNIQSWLLPQLLVSATLALAEFGKSIDPTPLNGYLLLKFMGREVTTFRGRDKWDDEVFGDQLPASAFSKSTFLRDWIVEGTKPAPHLEVLQLLDKELKQGLGRDESLLSVIEQFRTFYSQSWKQYEDQPWHALPETWELREDIDLALNDIAEYVKHLPTKS